MAAKRRFLTAILGSFLSGGSPQRKPVGNIASVACVELMESAGAWLPQAHLEAETMARLAAAGHTFLGYDTVMPVFCMVQILAPECTVSLTTPLENLKVLAEKAEHEPS